MTELEKIKFDAIICNLEVLYSTVTKLHKVISELNERIENLEKHKEINIDFDMTKLEDAVRKFNNEL